MTAGAAAFFEPDSLKKLLKPLPLLPFFETSSFPSRGEGGSGNATGPCFAARGLAACHINEDWVSTIPARSYGSDKERHQGQEWIHED